MLDEAMPTEEDHDSLRHEEYKLAIVGPAHIQETVPLEREMMESAEAEIRAIVRRVNDLLKHIPDPAKLEIKIIKDTRETIE